MNFSYSSSRYWYQVAETFEFLNIMMKQTTATSIQQSRIKDPDPSFAALHERSYVIRLLMNCCFHRGHSKCNMALL